MKKICVLAVFIGVLTVRLNAQSCNIKQCIFNTFDVNHANWWTITNSVGGKTLSDSFVFIESKSGDSSFNHFNGSISVLLTPSLTLITEFEDKSIYCIPVHKNSPKSARPVNSVNLDVIVEYFDLESSNEIDSVGFNTFQTINDGSIIQIKIQPELCLVESIIMQVEELEDGTDKQGFYSQKKVTRTITYKLLRNENAPEVVRDFIKNNTYVEVQKNATKIKEAYKNYGFTLENLNEQ